MLKYIDDPNKLRREMPFVESSNNKSSNGNFEPKIKISNTTIRCPKCKSRISLNEINY